MKNVYKHLNKNVVTADRVLDTFGIEINKRSLKLEDFGNALKKIDNTFNEEQISIAFDIL